jgi:hypothetical protein
MSDKSTKANLIAKILFIVGGIILFIVIAVFIFKMVPYAISNVANVGSSIKGSVFGSEDEIKISTDSDTATAKTPIIISFEYTPQVAGEYFISYKCADGLLYDIESTDGSKRIICNVPFKLGTNVDSISITPLFTKTNSLVDSIVTITYKDENDKTVAEGSKTITIKNTDTPTTIDDEDDLSGSTVTTKPITKPVDQTPKPIPTYTSPTKDLVLTYLEGRSDSTFIMHVYNYGNTSTGSWKFSYTDAENPSDIITSKSQPSLGPRQGLAVTVHFSGQADSPQTIDIEIDPSDAINETNESNNSGSIDIEGDPSNTSYNKDEDADLIIEDMEVGRMSGNDFREDDQIDTDDTAGVKFTVRNKGGEATGSWKFEITGLPYNSNNTYLSESYDSLKPGESLEVVVEFDGIKQGDYSIEVELDSDDDIDEEEEDNNTDSENLEVEGEDEEED